LEENEEDFVLEENQDFRTTRNVQVRNKSTSAINVSTTSVIHTSTSKILDANLMFKVSDGAVPSIGDQGFQMVTTRAAKKSEKLKVARKNTYPLRSRVGNTKPLK